MSKTPAYYVEIRSPGHFPTELIYDYKRYGQPTDAVAAEMIEAHSPHPQVGEIDTLKIIRNTGPAKGEVVAASTGIITFTDKWQAWRALGYNV